MNSIALLMRWPTRCLRRPQQQKNTETFASPGNTKLLLIISRKRSASRQAKSYCYSAEASSASNASSPCSSTSTHSSLWNASSISAVKRQP